LSGPVNITVAQNTHAGLQREDNQDDMAWFSLPGVELFVVVDGMGGAVGGKIAASMAVEAIQQAFSDYTGTIPDRLIYSLSEANRQIHLKSRSENPQYQGMGTTAVVMAICPDGLAYVAHVGDSRLYLHRNNQLVQITKDHTVLQRRIDNGLITPVQAKNATDGHILTLALGPKEETQPEVGRDPIRLQPEDKILMCTDGLSDTVSDGQIAAIIDSDETIEQVCNALVDAALNAGGPDNITVQIVNIDGTSSKTTPAPSMLPEVGSPIEQPVQNSKINKWYKGWTVGIAAVFIVAAAITLIAANGRFEQSLKRLCIKASELVNSVFESESPAPETSDPLAHTDAQDDSYGEKVKNGDELDKHLDFH
jgi:PPM family protein phosphatase